MTPEALAALVAEGKRHKESAFLIGRCALCQLTWPCDARLLEVVEELQKIAKLQDAALEVWKKANPSADGSTLATLTTLRSVAAEMTGRLADAEIALAASEEREKVLAEACKEIVKGQGPYHHEPLIHAAHTIEAMRSLAREALASVESKR